MREWPPGGPREPLAVIAVRALGRLLRHRWVQPLLYAGLGTTVMVVAILVIVAVTR